MTTVLTLLIILLIAYYSTKTRMLHVAKHAGQRPASLPSSYGWVSCIYGGLAFGIVILMGRLLPIPYVSSYALGGALVAALCTLMLQSPQFRARQHAESCIRALLLSAALTAVGITAAIIATLLFEALQFFERVSVWSFLTGATWAPQTAPGQPAEFGVIPLFAGTLLITSIALVIAIPLGLLSAIYLSEYASSSKRKILKPLVEVLAGIPTIVYGFFAISVVMPGLQHIGAFFGVSVSAESALGVGLVMGVLILPLIASLSDDALRAVPQALRDNSLALGATQGETILRVALPAATPGIIAGLLLGLSRAIGETMLVVMAAGLSAHMTLNPLESVTTITVQIVSLLTGDQEYGSTRTLSAFALGLLLFLLTFILNLLAVRIVRHYREKYA